MRFAAIFGIFGIYLLGAAAGCSTDTGSSEDFTRATCVGAKLDAGGYCRTPNGRFAKSSCCAVAPPPVKYACDVVDVNYALNSDLLEESLVSRNDISEDGYLDGDEGGIDADLQIGADAQSVWLGNYSWSNEDGDRIEEVPRDQIDVSQWLDQEVVEYTVTPATGDGVYRFRIFKDSLAGVVFHEGNGADGALAALDCRDVLSKPMAQPIDEEDMSCDITWFDYDLRDYDGQFGAPMTLDYFDTSSGSSEIDESYISVYIDLEEAGWDITLGGYTFEEADGDAVTFEQSQQDEELGDQLTWKIAGDGWDDTFEVRIWRGTGMGVVLVDETADEPAGRLAVLDCRGHGYPDVYSF